MEFAHLSYWFLLGGKHVVLFLNTQKGNVSINKREKENSHIKDFF